VGKTRVLVACRNRLLRDSIARILAKRAEFEVVATEVAETISREETVSSGASVIVMDSLESLVENDDCVSGAGVERGSVELLLIAMQDNRKDFVTAIRRGALGYVLEDASASDVLSAIRAVAQGVAVCPLHYMRVLFECVARQCSELPNNYRRAQTGLTIREQQIVPLIGRGLANKEIANQLGLSEQTVKNHVHRILRKVGAEDRLGISDALLIA
jgi:DNA-binding NarL/FixJ family response regulator